MPRKKRALKELSSDSEEEDHPMPPRKKSRRVATKQKQKEDKNKNMHDLEIWRYESIAIIAPNPDKIKGCTKIAAFDMDWTLIKPKSTKKFPQNRKDWVWMFGDNLFKKNVVPNKLKKLHQNGYQIVIFSNQNGIGTKKQSLDDVAGKIIDLSEHLEIPIFGFLSIQKDHWRKPTPSMWDHFASNYNNNVKIDNDASFYCGDAAGRPKGWKDKKTKKDFSCSDRKFAHNVGVSFHTPEPYFLGETENKTWKWLSLNPLEWIEQKEHDPELLKEEKNWFHGKLPIAKEKGLSMVLMRGPPGCGKTTFAKKYLVQKGYEWINRDTLKTKKKCLDKTRECLKNGKNVVIDNTNPDSVSREKYIEIGSEYKANIRLFNMKTEREVAEHLNLFRERMSKGACKRIPGMVYNIFYKKVRESDPPSLEEGFDEICDIDFIPDFKDDEEKRLWLQYT